MKKFLVTCLATVSLLILGACGSSDSNKSTSSNSEDKITIWAWDDTFNVKAADEAKAVYQKENADIEVDIVSMSQEDIVQKLNTGLASGNIDGLPNVVLIEDYRIQGYLSSYPDAFSELTDIVKEEDFASYKFAVNKVDDKIYGVPFDSGVTGLFYRKDYLEEAGYKEDDLTDITWDDFLKIAKDVKKETGHQMMSLNPSDLGMARIFMQSSGDWYTAEDGKTVTIKDNESLKYGLNILSELINNDLVELVSDWDGGVNAVRSGNVASSVTGSWYSSSIQGAEDQSGKWGIAKIPNIANDSDSIHASNLGGSGWYVLKGVSGEETSKDFLSKTFSTDKELMGTLADEIGLVSTMNAAKETEQYQTGSDFYGGQKVFEDLSNWSQEVKPVNYGQETYIIESILTESFQQIVNGENIDKVLDATQKQVEAQIGK